MSRILFVFAGLLALPACQNAPIRDLAENPKLYRPTGFRARTAMPLRVYVEPLVDRRGPLVPHTGMFPLMYTEDRYWQRPVATMLDDLIRQELASSNIFADVVDSREAADWVLEPSLLEFHGAVEERIAGRAVHGRTTMHVKVLGPRGQDGQRPVLREKRYEGPVDAAGMMFVPDPHALAASSFRKACGLMLMDLEIGGRLLRGRAVEASGFDPKREKGWSATSGH